MGGKGIKTGGRDWAPGQCGNPNGRPKLPDDIKEARRLNLIEYERILNQYIFMSPSELAEVGKRSDLPALDLLVIKMIIEAIKKADVQRANFVIDRLVGKLKDPIELTGKLTTLEDLVVSAINVKPREMNGPAGILTGRTEDEPTE